MVCVEMVPLQTGRLSQCTLAPGGLRVLLSSGTTRYYNIDSDSYLQELGEETHIGREMNRWDDNHTYDWPLAHAHSRILSRI